ncbi:MAG: metallophosphoesterase family protein [Nanobdellota archaeon]
MKFAHLADCHIGSWRDPKMLDISTEAFENAVNICIERDVDFVLISGDLFNTALPGIERLKNVVIKLKELKDCGINIYIIQGSHDFSPSGKTMIDVLEGAGLVENVVKGRVHEDKLRLEFTIEPKNGIKITGMLGKKGMLEKNYYEDLDREYLEKENGFKIFMFHTALTELKSQELSKMESSPLSLLPKGFDYYAGGHVHEVINEDVKDYGKIIYPGPTFPNNFREVEKLKNGGLIIFDEGNVEYIPIKLFDVFVISIDCKNKSAEEINLELMQYAKSDVKDKIVTIRLYGKISSGRINDIGLGEVINAFYDNGAYFVMKNSSGLTTTDFEEIKVKDQSVDDLEESLIKEHIGQTDLNGIDLDEEIFTKKLMNAFMDEEREGERKIDFEERIKNDIDQVFKQLSHDKLSVSER